jgi:YHS domain-containing protein
MAVRAIKRNQQEAKTMTKDPVCGMEMDEKRAKATSTYDGKTYYFCGDGCRAAFEKEPQKFLIGEKRRAHRC